VGKSSAKSQHIVPACYLKEFVDPFTPKGQDPYVWIFDSSGKNPKRKAPENILKQNEFYTITMPDGTKDRSTEEYLSTIEARYASIFRKKIKKYLPLTEEEHHSLCEFTFAMIFRTQKTKQNIQDFLDKLIEITKQLEAAHSLANSKSQELRRHAIDAHSLNLVSLIPKNGMILKEMSLAFLCVPELGPRFITSDNPANLFNPQLQWQKMSSPGIVQQSVEITMPLSPKIALFMSWQNYKGYATISAAQTNEINRMTRHFANEKIVSSTRKTNLIWFSPIPIDVEFFLLFCRKQIESFLERMARRMSRDY